MRTSREVLFVAILTLCSFIMEEVFLGVTCVGSKVGSGEITDFLVFAVGQGGVALQFLHKRFRQLVGVMV